MSKTVQRGPFSSITRAIYLLLQGRIHFPKDRLGEIVDDGEKSPSPSVMSETMWRLFFTYLIHKNLISTIVKFLD